MSFLDDSAIELSCPDCGHKFTERLGKLKTNPLIPCGGCGKNIQINAQGVDAELRKVDDSLADLRRTIEGFNKKR
jgi:uncharacterized Zn finger protein